MTPRAAALSREVARMEETTTFTCPLKRGKPKQVHLGRAPEVIEQRRNVLAAAYAARPDRFVVGPPRAVELPEEVWINRALPVTPVDGSESANGRKEASLN